MSGKLSISKAWDEAKERIASDGRLFVIVALALIALPQAIVTTVGPPAELSGTAPSGFATFLALIAFLIGIAGQIAIVRLALGPTSVGEAISHGFRRLGWTLLAFIILLVGATLLSMPFVMLVGAEQLQLIAAGGKPDPSALGYLLLFMVGVLLVTVRFQMVIPVTTAESVGPIAILTRSWRLTGGQYWKFLGFLLAVLLVAFLLLIVPALVAGLFVQFLFGDVSPMSVGAMVFGLVAGLFQAIFGIGAFVTLARIYAQLTGEDQALEPSVPSSGT